MDGATLLDQRLERPGTLRPRDVPLRSGRPDQPRGTHAIVQSRGRIRQHDHPGRSDPGVALCPASPLATGFIVSLDMGKTWAQYDLQEFGRRSPCRFHRKNGDGWFRVDLRSGWVTPAEMLFIKPKTAPGGGPE